MDIQAIFDNYRRTITEHYFDMHGRVGRAQFWYFMLAVLAGAILISILQAVTFLPLLVIYHLAMLLPVAGMGARRLQDTGRDGKLGPRIQGTQGSRLIGRGFRFRRHSSAA